MNIEIVNRTKTLFVGIPRSLRAIAGFILLFMLTSIVFWKVIPKTYIFMHNYAVDRNWIEGDKVALYVDEEIAKEIFIKPIETLSQGNGLEITMIHPVPHQTWYKIYPVYINYKKDGEYYVTYSLMKNGKPSIKKQIKAKNVRGIDYYYKDDIQLSLRGAF